jgi:hypothetical protein
LASPRPAMWKVFRVIWVDGSPGGGGKEGRGCVQVGGMQVGHVLQTPDMGIGDHDQSSRAGLGEVCADCEVSWESTI